MIMSRSHASALRRALAPTLAIGLIIGLSPHTLAQPGAGGPPVLTVNTSDASVSRKIDMSVGRSVIVELPRDAKEVFVANPAVANAVVRSTRQLFVIGMQNGATSIFVMDADGRQIAALDVTIARDVNVLRETLARSIPGARFDIRAAGDSLVLSGSVGSAGEAQQAIDIANGFVGATAGARGAVINNLTIRDKDQVMLRVTVVEVARNVLKQFGLNMNGSWSNLDLVNSTPFNLAGQQYPQGNLLSGTVTGTGGASLTATLRAFEQAGVSRILAEPTLTAISGEAAKFLAGGEIPVPTTQNCVQTPGLLPTAQPYTNCIVGISFKPYGVSLSFTPVVLSENRISIRVATDVTEIDPQNSYNLVDGNSKRNVSIPGMTIRRSETTVELASGATMMTAGLIQQKSKASINGLPGLMNLPVLGSLFRSRDYQRQETELMILVTPFIAKPMQPSQISRPDDGYVEATDAQGILLGRLTKMYGTAGGYSAGRAYRGRVGFIND